MDDDDILNANVTANEDELMIKQDQTVIQLQHLVIPLRISELMDEYFMEVLEKNKNVVNLNIFLLGYRQDQGIRACGGRSGAELGYEVFSETLFKKHTVLANQLKQNGVQIYDLGEITKYQLSIYQNNQQTKDSKTLTDVVNYILEKVPKSKIVLIGGSDDLCKGLHEAEAIKDIIHIDSQIDAKERFKLQLNDKNSTGQPLFKPSYLEHHGSYLRTLYTHENVHRPDSLIFFGLQGHRVSQEDVDWVRNTKIPHTQLCFYDRDIKPSNLRISSLERPSSVTGPSAVCLDLSAFKAEYAPGVSEINPVSGFTESEMQEIVLDLVD